MYIFLISIVLFMIIAHKCETINAWYRWCMLLLINMTLKKNQHFRSYAFVEGEGVIKKRTLCGPLRFHKLMSIIVNDPLVGPINIT